MKRREFITLIGALAMTPPSAAFAQQSPNRMARIVYLGATGAAVIDPRQIQGFKQGLRENGLIEGRNVTVDYFWAEGDASPPVQLAGEVSKAGYDVVLTAGPQAVHALTRAHHAANHLCHRRRRHCQRCRHIASAAERQRHRFVDVNSDLESKRIEILKEAAPSVTRVMALRITPAWA